MHYELPSHILETIISPTGSYKAVTAHHQKAMAVEILKRRKIMAELERKLGELVIDKADLITEKLAAKELNHDAYEIGEKVDVKVLDGKHFIKNLVTHDWSTSRDHEPVGSRSARLDLLRGGDRGEKDRWFEVVEVNIPVLEDTFSRIRTNQILLGICEDAFPETPLSTSGYFADEAYIAGAMFRNSEYTVRLHRECGFKGQSYGDYLRYTWELQ